MEFICTNDGAKTSLEEKKPEGSFLIRALLSTLKGLIALLLGFLWLLLSASIS